MALTTSILKGTDNNYETTAEMANAVATDFISQGTVGAITNTGGVAPTTGAFAVNAKDTPGMAVDVSSGTAYVTATPTGQGSQTLRVKSSATEEVTISANSTGDTRYDHIYIAIDATNSAAPNSTGTNAASLVTSRSTSASTDDGTPPTYGYKIAVVTVANGASSITDANISDSRTGAGTIPADDAVTDAKRTRIKSCVAVDANQSTSTATPTALSFADADLYDPEGWHNSSTNNSRITVSEAGVYCINALVLGAGIASSEVGIIYLYKNGSGIEIAPGGGDIVQARLYGTTATAEFVQVDVPYIELSANDYVEVYAEHSGGEVLWRDRRFTVIKLSD